VSKLSGLKVLKLSKMAERLGMATISSKVSRDSGTSKSGIESLGQSIFLANCGQNSWVPFIGGCQDPRVT
jgi:hypothetical protein